MKTTPKLYSLLSLFALLTACAEGAMTTTAGGLRKWVGPEVRVPGGGNFRTVIHYGPWQCSPHIMNYCRDKCAGEGYVLQGCIWLADVKMDFTGDIVRAGSRFGMTNCCCNYPTLSKAQNDVARGKWKNIRDGFRERWAEKFGEWPREADGSPYQGHHLRDLKHGGNPTDWDNIIPYPKELHETLGGLYNQCYANEPPWTGTGGSYPYGE
ncbi:hypothetical protein OV208_35315 [Corallococcus sp. bb12-1]|uniref:hypothetical protein n=1 Tax=Corallococcus sp. bb12-1 TaxID=2996784 RepID=UPI0022708EE6|nr:hypothetical protein [Corallococcus sp. bb12-1]MCY1046628.1 hypothetical protein [Corallococcus sp. bb12-1]